MVDYKQRFFASEGAAKAFQKGFGRGVLYSRAKKPESYLYEVMIAQEKGERVDIDETPYCVAWNEVKEC